MPLSINSPQLNASVNNLLRSDGEATPNVEEVA